MLSTKRLITKLTMALFVVSLLTACVAEPQTPGADSSSAQLSEPSSSSSVSSDSLSSGDEPSNTESSSSVSSVLASSSISEARQSSSSMPAQKFVRAEGISIIDEAGEPLFLRGINLGNWLLWEGYLMMGDFAYRTHTQFLNSLERVFQSREQALAFQHEWRLHYVDEQAIVDLKELGFNSVRVPFHFNMFWQNGQLTDEGFAYFDRLIEWCKDHGIYILLDMHAAPGYQNPGDHSDNLNSDETQPRESVTFWNGDTNIAIAANVWRYIANRYRDEPIILGYDLINEPVPQHGREYELLPSLITMTKAIREVDNNHMIVAEGSWWASDLTKLDWKDAQTQRQTGVTAQWDDNLVYQIHHYGPPADTFDRDDITRNLQIPLILGEYGETENTNIRQITDWALQDTAGYFPWSFKKMTHDRALWTIPPNAAYQQLVDLINSGETAPEGLFDELLEFIRANIKNGHPSMEWHADFYEAVQPAG